MLNVLSNAVSPSDQLKSYPALSTAFIVIGVSYLYVPSAVLVLSIYVLSVILNAYVSLSYVYVTLAEPSEVIVTLCTLGLANPVFDFIGASTSLFVSPYSVTSSIS